jgi:hypothetical protein
MWKQFNKFYRKLLDRNFEFANVVLSIFLVFTDSYQFIIVEKIDLIGYDPVGRLI